jgi:hypothetical protein
MITPIMTPGFDTELSIRAKTARTWELISPLIWTGTQLDIFMVPAAFVTDLASVPRCLHWLILPYGAYTRAAVLHDWLITERINHSDPALRVTSRDVDGIFRRVMQDLEVSWAERWTMWAAVRAGAALNPRRAPGRAFHRDLPKVLAIALAAGPIVSFGVVGVLISLSLVRIVKLFRR